MLDISNTTSSAFREPPGSATAALLPTFSMAPLAGGVGYAKIGTTFRVDDRRVMIVRDADAVRRHFEREGIKTFARCLGVMRQTEFQPCPHCAEAETFDELLAAHPSLDDLKKRNEVHVFCGWSDAPMDPEEHAKAMQRYQGFVTQLEKLEDKGQMLDAAALRAKLGWANNRGREPVQEIVGLFMPQPMSGKWLHAHADRK